MILDGQIGGAKDGQLGADHSLNSGGFGGERAIRVSTMPTWHSSKPWLVGAP
jgi:hypothetical protein